MNCLPSLKAGNGSLFRTPEPPSYSITTINNNIQVQHELGQAVFIISLAVVFIALLLRNYRDPQRKHHYFQLAASNLTQRLMAELSLCFDGGMKELAEEDGSESEASSSEDQAPRSRRSSKTGKRSRGGKKQTPNKRRSKKATSTRIKAKNWGSVPATRMILLCFSDFPCFKAATLFLCVSLIIAIILLITKRGRSPCVVLL